METLNTLMTFLYRLFTFSFLFLACSVVNAQEPMRVPKISGKIIFDGVPDEEAWQQIPSLKLAMHTPVYGNEPTETSILKITYDNEYLYVSGKMYYKDPSTMRAVSKKRDYATFSSDWLGIIIDSFNDRKNAVSFFTNPNGVRSDATAKNDVMELDDINFSWNTFWDTKTVINNSGWSAELRIPFSSLRFQVKEGVTTMGIIIFRYMAAKNEIVTYPSISPDYPFSYWKPSLSSLVTFEGIKPINPVYFTPYITSGLSQVNEINGAGNSYKIKSTPKYDAGMDVKFSLTNNLTLDMTLNTDFAQVEADDQKINLTRYSLFFPEKRVFFQEKADVFDFSFLGGNNLFYSRRIGIWDGNPVRIYGGARLTGRVNKWDIGILDMQTAPYANNPGENFAVARTKKTVFNQNSFVGGMLTSRLGMNGTYNLAYGADAQFRVTGDEYLTVKLAQTFETGASNKVFDLSPSRLLFRWDRRTQTGFGYDFLYTYSGDSFNPGIGFETKENYHGIRTILQYGWLPAENSAIRYNKISIMAYNFWNTATGRQETFSGILTWLFEGKKGYSGSIFGTWFQEDLTDTLTLGNDQAFVPPGRYPFANFTIQYNTSGSNKVSGEFLAEAGSFYDGWKISFSGTPMLNIGSGFNMGLTYNLDYVTFSQRMMNFTNHIVGIKGLLTMTTKTSLSAFVQYNTAIDKVMANMRIRYNPREGNDFYFVYDEGLNTRLKREFPTLPYSYGRTILLKYTYTFRF
jgi:hypothetical protein